MSIYCQYMLGYTVGYGLANMSWVQLYFICELGQNIQDNGFTEALYDINWEILPNDIKKALMLLIRRKQNVPGISLGPLSKSINREIFQIELIVRMEDGTIKTDWHHKETWSGRYLHFNSHLPFNYKRNTIKILVDKIIKLAEPEFHQRNFKLVERVLMDNGYPRKLIWNTITNTLKTKTTNEQKETVNEGTSQYVAIPYVRGLFEQIAPIFKDTEKKIVGGGGNNFNRSIFTKVKDEVPKMQKSHVVYKIPCSCELCYVGESRNRLETREDGHKYNIEAKNGSHSALCKHVLESKLTHTPRWNDAEILFQDRNAKSRQIKEMIAIKKTVNNMNHKTDTLFLSTIYNDLLGIESNTSEDMILSPVI